MCIRDRYQRRVRGGNSTGGMSYGRVLVLFSCVLGVSASNLWWSWQILANGASSNHLGQSVALARFHESNTLDQSGPSAVLGMASTAYLSANTDRRLFSGPNKEFDMSGLLPFGRAALVSSSAVTRPFVEACVAVSMQGKVRLSLLTSGDTGHNVYLPTAPRTSMISTPQGLRDFGRSVKVVDTTVFIGARNASTGDGVVTTWYMRPCQQSTCDIETQALEWSRGADIAAHTPSASFGAAVVLIVSGESPFQVAGPRCLAAVSAPDEATVDIFTCHGSLPTDLQWQHVLTLAQPAEASFGTALAVAAEALFVSSSDSNAVHVYSLQGSSSSFTLVQTIRPQNRLTSSFGASLGSSWQLGASPQDSTCLLYTSPSPRDRTRSRMPSSA
eukprot:TRINITY_DN616_c0_g1_i1.p1 TRINITY_DN616_c0_g1~~TRINITY_DN616_c0_g1_i1.p1  ORF type:complete len:387 (+),score=96.86 TRINITY_DN616_c0_g1_i1:146-1306(+)